jgi:hypothetical protein
MAKRGVMDRISDAVESASTSGPAASVRMAFNHGRDVWRGMDGKEYDPYTMKPARPPATAEASRPGASIPARARKDINLPAPARARAISKGRR